MLSLRLLYIFMLALGLKLALSLIHMERGCEIAIVKNPSAADLKIDANGPPHGGDINCREVAVTAKISQGLLNGRR